MFDERLIREIQKRQSLYDKTNEDYNNYKVKDHAWEDIAHILEAPVTKCKARWKSLRERFVREVKRNRRLGYPEDTTRWNHFKKMNFIKDFICPRNRYPNDNGPQRIQRENSTHFTELMEVLSDSSEADPLIVPVSPSQSNAENPIESNGVPATLREIAIQTPTISATNAGFFLMMDKFLQRLPPEEIVHTQIEILNFMHQKLLGRKPKVDFASDE